MPVCRQAAESGTAEPAGPARIICILIENYAVVVAALRTATRCGPAEKMFLQSTKFAY